MMIPEFRDLRYLFFTLKLELSCTSSGALRHCLACFCLAVDLSQDLINTSQDADWAALLGR